VLVGPLKSIGDDAAIRSLLLKIRYLLEQTICSFEVATIKCRSVTDHDLGAILVGHDDSWLR